MSEPSSKILDRIRKLLRLANDPSSPAEAAIAAERAQALMFEHQIAESELELDGGTAQAPIGEEEIDATKLRTTWKVRLATFLAYNNFCRVLTTVKMRPTTKACPNERHSHGQFEYQNNKFCGMERMSVTVLMGRPDATATVRYLYAYLVNEVERLAKRDGINGRTALNNYRLGATNVIGWRLREQRERSMRGSANSRALVLVNREEAAVMEYEKKKNLKNAPRTRETMDERARRMGESAGEEINIDGGGQRLGPTAKKLGAAR